MHVTEGTKRWLRNVLNFISHRISILQVLKRASCSFILLIRTFGFNLTGAIKRGIVEARSKSNNSISIPQVQLKEYRLPGLAGNFRNFNTTGAIKSRLIHHHELWLSRISIPQVQLKEEKSKRSTKYGYISIPQVQLKGSEMAATAIQKVISIPQVQLKAFIV